VQFAGDLLMAAWVGTVSKDLRFFQLRLLLSLNSQSLVSSADEQFGA
jgi:hypothetical protein